MKDTIDLLIQKWQKEHDHFQNLLDENKSKSVGQLYMAHFETRQIGLFINDLNKLKAML